MKVKLRHFGSGFLTCFQNAWKCFNVLMKLITVMHYQVQITMTTFLGHGFRGQGHRQYFSEIYFRIGIPIDGSLSKAV